MRQSKQDPVPPRGDHEGDRCSRAGSCGGPHAEDMTRVPLGIPDRNVAINASIAGVLQSGYSNAAAHCRQKSLNRLLDDAQTKGAI